eukprot:GHVL01038193.1.p1 GENE.GHVL01038193.1~~GHVL01038193.1.p1  ORF type:complete len:115 (-),score=6.86 GHVL01038193.1:57-401(-)
MVEKQKASQKSSTLGKWSFYQLILPKTSCIVSNEYTVMNNFIYRSETNLFASFTHASLSSPPHAYTRMHTHTQFCLSLCTLHVVHYSFQGNVEKKISQLFRFQSHTRATQSTER